MNHQVSTPRGAPPSPPQLNAPKKIRGQRVFVTYGPDEMHPSKIYNERMAGILARSNSSPALTSHAAKETVTPLQVEVVNMVKQYLTADDEPSSAISAVSTESAPDRFELQEFSTTTTKQHTQGAIQAPPPTKAPLAQNAFPHVFTEDEYRGMLHRAQNLFGPESRVVVGNLQHRMPNNVLSALVWEGFGKYGDCAVCVFRGQGKHGARRPYAIIQYDQIQNAAAAYYCGNEMIVGGRPVRVEMSRQT